MKVIDIRHRDAMDFAVAELHHSPVVVQLPTVFVLLAAPTGHGARHLDECKTRLAGKNYGTAIGSLERFLAHADKAHLPDAFSVAEHFEPMTGSFIRLRFRGADFQSPTIRDGTHQGVLLDGPHRQLFQRIEAAFQAHPPEPIWGGANYSAPLCTSCNVSGDPEGAIVRTDKALAFARQRGLRLVLTCAPASGELGSYPILGYERAGVRVLRAGPGLERFKAQVPAALRAW